MTVYIGNGPYCYANSLAMVLGSDEPSPSQLEVLTGSPFGFTLLAGRLPLPSPYGWDPNLGLDEALGLLGWSCERAGAADEKGDPDQALAALREAVAHGPVLVGPVEMGLLRHHPEMAGGHPIGSDHYVVVLDADADEVVFHDPHGAPYATLPVGQFLDAWRAETIDYPHAPYTLRHDFRRVRPVTLDEAMRSATPGWVAWLRGRQELPAPPGSLSGAEGVRGLAAMVRDGLPPDIEGHLAYFAVRVGARRSGDAAAVLASLGHQRAAQVATRQARLFGSLQYDIVQGRAAQAAQTLDRLAPTYADLADALEGRG